MFCLQLATRRKKNHRKRDRDSFIGTGSKSPTMAGWLNPGLSMGHQILSRFNRPDSWHDDGWDMWPKWPLLPSSVQGYINTIVANISGVKLPKIMAFDGKIPWVEYVGKLILTCSYFKTKCKILKPRNRTVYLYSNYMYCKCT